jgi:hypothetical protein
MSDRTCLDCRRKRRLRRSPARSLSHPAEVQSQELSRTDQGLRLLRWEGLSRRRGKASLPCSRTQGVSSRRAARCGERTRHLQAGGREGRCTFAFERAGEPVSLALKTFTCFSTARPAGVARGRARVMVVLVAARASGPFGVGRQGWRCTGLWVGAGWALVPSGGPCTGALSVGGIAGASVLTHVAARAGMSGTASTVAAVAVVAACVAVVVVNILAAPVRARGGVAGRRRRRLHLPLHLPRRRRRQRQRRSVPCFGDRQQRGRHASEQNQPHRPRLHYLTKRPPSPPRSPRFSAACSASSRDGSRRFDDPLVLTLSATVARRAAPVLRRRSALLPNSAALSYYPPTAGARRSAPRSARSGNVVARAPPRKGGSQEASWSTQKRKSSVAPAWLDLHYLLLLCYLASAT